ncbi:MAG: glycosyltransferase [Bacteroidales bacterium]|nr:glycosyltransferase [Bacteroidales bacterium]
MNINFSNSINRIDNKINTQIFRAPDIIRRKWERYLLKKINEWYLIQFINQKPDLVFIYNNAFVLPETLIWLKRRNVRIVFFLGDNPLFTHTSRYNLAILDYADAIFVPDTFWEKQLKKTGLSRVYYLMLPLPDEDYYPVSPETIDKEFKEHYRADIFYIGMGYNDSWGYKKAKFLSYFTNYDLKLYGNKAWRRWFQFFPELERFYTETNKYIPTSDLNKIYNLTKIIPVDGNPGIFNGIHLRTLEALAAGALPLMEYNMDMNIVFEGVEELPVVKDFREIPDKAVLFLNDEKLRIKTVDEMKMSFLSKYSLKATADTILQKL